MYALSEPRYYDIVIIEHLVYLAEGLYFARVEGDLICGKHAAVIFTASLIKWSILVEHSKMLWYNFGLCGTVGY